MKGLLQCNAYYRDYYFAELMESAKRHNIVLCDAREIVKEEDYDFTLNKEYNEKDISLQRGKQFNRLTDGYFWKSKERQFRHLNLEEGMLPKTIFGKDLSFDYVCELLGCPFVAKKSISSRGEGTYLIHSQKEFLEAAGCDIYQEMIWETAGRDLRVWCLGGEVLGVMQRTSSDGDFRANTHLGGTGSVYKCDAEIKNIASLIYSQTELSMVGIDLIFGKHGYMFCELNVNPGFKEFDQVMNWHTADYIMDYIKNSV